MAEAKPKPPRNDALRMLGLPALPRKLPSRNWLIFWGVTTSFAAALIYDARERRKATARWSAAVAPLATEPISSPSAMPRRITVYLEAPPGDGLRSAQDHFNQYVKPVLCSSGLDWEFVVGRQQGDVRAVVAERVRRSRRTVERDLGNPSIADAPTDVDIVEEIRRRNGVPEYVGVKGDIIVGRHTWKEYVRGLHEGWLGPLTPPEAKVPEKVPEVKVAEVKEVQEVQEKPVEDAAADAPAATPESPAAPAPDADDKPKRPKQLPPYNTPDEYPSSPLPRFIPAELGPSMPIPFPHLLGFFNTPTRLRRYLTRRRLADDIGRDVAAICFGASREYREDRNGYEQRDVLVHEERDWVKSVWKEAEDREAGVVPKPDEAAEGETEAKEPAGPPKELIWASSMVLDSRIAERMRQFALAPDVEERARAYVVPEALVEGWTKGKLRQLGRWGVRTWKGDRKTVNVGNLDDVE